MLNFQELILELAEQCNSHHLVKISLGHYRGELPQLTKIIIKPVLIKQARKLSFIYRYKTRDVTKNFELIEAQSQIESSLGRAGFQAVVIQNIKENLSYSMTKKGLWKKHREPVPARAQPSLDHDRRKQRSLQTESTTHWQALRLTDAAGNVYKAAQDKWKQINHYIDILGPALEGLPKGKQLRVVDMGAGKGYLTFALYDYLNHVLKRSTQVEGVEYREDLVDFCNKIAKESDFQGLTFAQGTIEDFDHEPGLDVLIALHACDTATDDAIYKGIASEASLIVVAPCCHKQVRRELTRSNVTNDMDFMTRYGIFMERHAEMLTDSIRSLILEYFGYRTKVMQFISDEHTPKNVMIVGERVGVDAEKQKQLLDKLQSIKSYFGLRYHHLERLMGMEIETA
ncbi:MAG: class I SAM-dependent methyltransferase [Sphingobacteriaceae bacterium]